MPERSIEGIVTLSTQTDLVILAPQAVVIAPAHYHFGDASRFIPGTAQEFDSQALAEFLSPRSVVNVAGPAERADSLSRIGKVLGIHCVNLARGAVSDKMQAPIRRIRMTPAKEVFTLGKLLIPA